jgi:hypothetical protein
LNPSYQVVSPPNQQGSILGRIVSESALGLILYWVVFCRANARVLASVQAELEALRATKLFSFTVGNDNGYCICALCQTPGYKQKSHAKPSILELFWEMCVRVPQLTRRIEVFTNMARTLPAGEYRAEVKQELADTILAKTVAYPCLQDRAAGTDAYQKALRAGRSEADAIFSGEVARSKSIGPYTTGLFTEITEPQRDEVVFKPKSRIEKGAFDCRDCHISSPEEWATFFDDLAHKLVRREELSLTNELSEELFDYKVTDLCTDQQIAAWYPHIKGGVANSSSILSSFYGVTNDPQPSEKRFIALPVKPWVDANREEFLNLYGESLRNANGINLRKGETRADYAARHKNGKLGSFLPNWCDTCKQYVAWSHDGPGGIPCKDYLKTLAADEAKRVATMYEPTERVVTRPASTSCSDGPINTNWVEDKWIARLDRNKALRLLSAKCKPCVEYAPKVKKGRKPKRHYVRHKRSFVRTQN